MKINLIT